MPLTEVDVARLNDDVFASTGTNKNRIINGDMRIDQRNSGTLVSNANGYITDRWTLSRFTSGSGVYSGQQVTDAPTAFKNSLKVTVTTAESSQPTSAFWQATQYVEGYNVADFGFGTSSPSTFTLSFWVKSSVTGTYSLAFYNNAQGGTGRSYITTYTVNSANTWEYKTITATADGAAGSGLWSATTGYGVSVIFDLGSGSDQQTTSGSWQTGNFRRTSGSVRLMATNGATFNVTGVQLEAGDTATPFERRNYGQELILCQRYFQKIIWSRDDYGLAVNTVNDFRGTHFDFPVELRASPTFVVNQGWNLYQSNASFWNNPNAWIFYSNNKSWQPVKDLTGEPALTNFTNYLLRSNVGSNNGYTGVNINVSAEL